MKQANAARWLRIWRYSVGSIIAAATSFVVFACCYGIGVPTVPANVVAFVAGAVPNWVLNRSWAWQRTGRVHVGREVLSYAVVSLLSLAASSAATGWADRRSPQIADDHTTRVVFVAAAYVLTYGVLFVLKYLVYEWVIFRGTSERRSRHQVPTTTRPKRSP